MCFEGNHTSTTEICAMLLQRIERSILYFSCILLTFTSIEIHCDEPNQGGTETTPLLPPTQANPFANACPFNITLPDNNHEPDCGISSATADTVLGGAEAQRGVYPWIAGLAYGKPGDMQPEFRCAGALISRRHVLTSAQCVTSDLYMVRLGAHILNPPDQSDVRDVQIIRKLVYPADRYLTIEIDIALLELRKGVAITAHIRPICLPYSQTIRLKKFTGCKPLIAGWGMQLFQGLTSNTSTLRDAQVCVIVKDKDWPYRDRFSSYGYILAADGHGDDCRASPGSPLMLPVPSADGNRIYFYLIGIAEYGYECAKNDFPGVYAKVGSCLNWIMSEVN